MREGEHSKPYDSGLGFSEPVPLGEFHQCFPVFPHLGGTGWLEEAGVGYFLPLTGSLDSSEIISRAYRPC